LTYCSFLMLTFEFDKTTDGICPELISEFWIAQSTATYVFSGRAWLKMLMSLGRCRPRLETFISDSKYPSKRFIKFFLFIFY
jgi:hypothetical protein